MVGHLQGLPVFPLLGKELGEDRPAGLPPAFVFLQRRKERARFPLARPGQEERGQRFAGPSFQRGIAGEQAGEGGPESFRWQAGEIDGDQGGPVLDEGEDKRAEPRDTRTHPDHVLHDVFRAAVIGQAKTGTFHGRGVGLHQVGRVLGAELSPDGGLVQRHHEEMRLQPALDGKLPAGLGLGVGKEEQRLAVEVAEELVVGGGGHAFFRRDEGGFDVVPLPGRIDGRLGPLGGDGGRPRTLGDDAVGPEQAGPGQDQSGAAEEKILPGRRRTFPFGQAFAGEDEGGDGENGPDRARSVPGHVGEAVDQKGEDGSRTGGAGDPTVLVPAGAGLAEKEDDAGRQREQGGKAVFRGKPDPVAFRMPGDGLDFRAAAAEAGEEGLVVARADAKERMGGEEVERIALQAEAKAHGGGGGFVRVDFLPGVGGDGFGQRIRLHPLERFGSLIKKGGGGQGGAGEEKDADAAVGSDDGLADGPGDKAEEEDSESAPGGVGGEASEDRGEGEEGEAGGEETLFADVGVDRAGEEDAGDGQPVGHVVGVGEDPVDGGDGEGKGPALDAGDEGEDADGGDEPAVGTEEEETFLRTEGLGAGPGKPGPTGEEQDQAFQGNLELGDVEAEGGLQKFLEGREKAEEKGREDEENEGGKAALGREEGQAKSVQG